ncbi:MAG: hypoxanthine phosphoribosyltransferase [Candidatus Caenarcaniphilales bacterium]|nr:hypoxanthine phosphoribosyltransferase [Candidatus Caenarcaniphilales bacterium]
MNLLLKPTVFISKESIENRIQELAKEINGFYDDFSFEDEPLVLVGVLKGALIFCADLIRSLDLPVQLEFVRIASYGDSTQSSGTLSTPDLSLPSSIAHKHILIVEDIVDTGRTAAFLKQYIQDQFNPKSLKLVSLLTKPSRREVTIDPDFYGFEIEDKFVVGYGLDWAERYRELNYLGIVECNE